MRQVILSKQAASPLVSCFREQKLPLVLFGPISSVPAAGEPYDSAGEARNSAVAAHTGGIGGTGEDGHGTVAEPLRCHPDMLFTWLTPRVYYRGDASKLTYRYPGDIRYNAASTGKYFIHNLKYTDPELLEVAEGLGLQLINVRQGYVELPGFDTGFIGGCSGRVGDTIYFNGNLAAHPDGSAIRDFILSRGLSVQDFPGYPLTDIGSILEVRD